jgi:hypothetical protein
MTLKALAPTVAIAGIAAFGIVDATPAQAMNLAPGSFQLTGTNAASLDEFTTSPDNTTKSFTLIFDGDAFSIASAQSAFAGITKSGSLMIEELDLTGANTSGSTVFSIFNVTPDSQGYIPFITGGLSLNGETILVDILASTQFFGVANPNNPNFNLTSPILDLRVRDSSHTVLGDGFASAVNLGGLGEDSISVVTVPTPALLPGLVGFGIAALRKKQGDKREQEA